MQKSNWIVECNHSSMPQPHQPFILTTVEVAVGWIITPHKPMVVITYSFRYLKKDPLSAQARSWSALYFLRIDKFVINERRPHANKIFPHYQLFWWKNRENNRSFTMITWLIYHRYHHDSRVQFTVFIICIITVCLSLILDYLTVRWTSDSSVVTDKLYMSSCTPCIICALL